MLPRFLFPPIERLSANGAFETVDGPATPGRAPVVLLARELCAFEFLAPAAGQAGDDAARRRAEQAGPFVNAGSLVRRQGPGFAIWWWDLDAVAGPLRDRFDEATPRLLPVSLAQPAGVGWRVVRSAPGFEAQFWRGGVLRASAWRPGPFDEAAWLNFVRLLREPDAPIAPPAPETLPVVWTRARAALARNVTAREAGLAAAAAAVALMGLATVFFLGQGLRLAAETHSIRATAAALVVPAAPPSRQDARRLAAYAALARRPNPVAGLARAIGVAELYGASPMAWSADHDQVSLILPYSAISSLDRIALELRGAGLFGEIRPVSDDEAGTIVLHLTLVGGAPPSPDE